MRSTVDRCGMENAMWFTLGDDRGVLEFDELRSLPGFALELHIYIDPIEDRTLAWWQTAQGAWLVIAGVGSG